MPVQGTCAHGRSLDDELDAQWEQFRPLAEDLDITSRENIVLPDAPELPARETCCTWQRSGTVFHQWQLALLLSDGVSLLVITQTIPGSVSRNDLLYRERLKQDLKLSVRGG